jgi:hypothetical protein
MDFTGRMYFSFGEPDVFRFYRLLATAATEGTRIGVEWVGITLDPLPAGPLVGDHLASAVAEDLRRAGSNRHGGYIDSLLTAIHAAGDDLADPGLVPRALDQAGCDSSAVLAPGNAAKLRAAIEASTAAAEALGVTGVPSLYRHGPVLLVRTTAALGDGAATPRLELISSVMEDDGLWQLSKP